MTRKLLHGQHCGKRRDPAKNRFWQPTLRRHERSSHVRVFFLQRADGLVVWVVLAEVAPRQQRPLDSSFGSADRDEFGVLSVRTVDMEAVIAARAARWSSRRAPGLPRCVWPRRLSSSSGTNLEPQRPTRPEELLRELDLKRSALGDVAPLSMRLGNQMRKMMTTEAASPWTVQNPVLRVVLCHDGRFAHGYGRPRSKTAAWLPRTRSESTCPSPAWAPAWLRRPVIDG